jgi:hypothetical protein
VGGDSSAWELARAPGPMVSLGNDDAARCGGQGLRSTATGGWHGGVDISERE